MKILNYLKPKFFRRLDQYLLVNHPFIWKTYVHYFLFYSLLVTNGVLALFVLLYPLNISSIPRYNSISQYGAWMTMFASVAYAFWLYLLNRSPKDIFTWRQAALSTVLYAVSILCLSSNIVLIPTALRYKIHLFLEQENFSEDYKQFNKAKNSAIELKEMMDRFEFEYALGEINFNLQKDAVEIKVDKLIGPHHHTVYKELINSESNPYYRDIAWLRSLAKELKANAQVMENKDLEYQDIHKTLVKRQEAILERYTKNYTFYPRVYNKLDYEVQHYVVPDGLDKGYSAEFHHLQVWEHALMNSPLAKKLNDKYNNWGYYYSLNDGFNNMADFYPAGVLWDSHDTSEIPYEPLPILGGYLDADYIIVYMWGVGLLLLAFVAAMLKQFNFVKLLLSFLVGLGVFFLTGFTMFYTMQEFHWAEDQKEFYSIFFAFGTQCLFALALLFVAYRFPKRIGVLEQIIHFGAQAALTLISFITLYLFIESFSYSLEARGTLPLLFVQIHFAWYLLFELVFVWAITYVLLRKINLNPRRK